MKKPNITEGDWEIFIGPRMDMGFICSTKNLSIGSKHKKTSESERANAKAISAAPEMIDALIDAYYKLRDWEKEIGEKGFEPMGTNEVPQLSMHVRKDILKTLKKAGCTDD